jgi:transcriptional antiterminator RfaH
MIMKFRKGWYVLYVRSSQENKTHQRLLEMGLYSFLPVIETIKQWSDRKKLIKKPLFPSYIFVKVTSPFDIHKVLSVKGACNFLRFGKEVALISEKEINQIKLLINADDVSEIQTEQTLPMVGDVRKIQLGSLADLECEVVKANRLNKIVVRIKSLRQNITAVIPSYYLSEKIPAI